MPDMNEHAETQQEYFGSRMNGKSQRCLEALIKLEAVKTVSTETLLKELKDRGEKHINPHYDIKEESANKGFTGIEVNGVRFSNIQEMLVYMDKQRNEIILLEKENAELRRDKEDLIFIRNQKAKCMGEDKQRLTKAKEIIRRLMDIINHDLKCFDTIAGLDVKQKAEQFLKESADIREDSTLDGDWVVDEH